MIKHTALLLLLAMTSSFSVAEALVVRGLFKGAVLLDIDGEQKLLREGATHPRGATVISADSRSAVVRYQGETRRLTLNKRIGTHYAEAETQEVVLQRNSKREYRTRLEVNGRSAEAVVDTGATSVAMSSLHARQLGIRYDDAPVVSVATASGMSRGFAVTLPKLAVGSIERHHVAAVVVEGDYPHVILLGMSFLEHVDMQEKGNILTLTAH
ncbi:TIGR02281 family clan AA aspartic protease [Spongiibacter tropicus]|uniref:TIGR02281 family clan AA aspartic protease n=1 Tax=Spongiibacter tropicus TaxID=454602 RepID=UPI0035BE1923